MNVNQVMTTPVRTCSSSTSLEEVARMMWEGDCGAIPVVSEANIPLGVVTDRDIAMAAMLNHQALWSIPAATVIQGQKPFCCGQQDSVESCVSQMEQHGVRRILVTDDSGALSGIVSLGDTVAFAQPDASKNRKDLIGADKVLGMLRKVSGHHQSGMHLPAQI